jgi:hypothetical protein
MHCHAALPGEGAAPPSDNAEGFQWFHAGIQNRPRGPGTSSDEQAGSRSTLRGGDGSRYRRCRFCFLQKRILGTAGSKYWRCLGLRSFLLGVPRPSIRSPLLKPKRRHPSSARVPPPSYRQRFGAWTLSVAFRCSGFWVALSSLGERSNNCRRCLKFFYETGNQYCNRL